MNRQNAWSRTLWPLALVIALWGVASIGPTVAPVVAQDGANAAADAGDAAATNATPRPRETMLEWIIKTSGWIGAVLLVLSIYFVAKVVSLFMELRIEVAAPPEIVEQCDNLLKAKDFMGIYKLVKQDNSFYSNVVAAGLTELPNGLVAARDGMERVGDTLTVEMEKNISMLAVLGSLGPMIGLLGTLKGMIGAFSVIAMSDTQLKASEVAGNISEALVLTFEGVGLSVPSIYFFALFRNRVASISTATMLAADEFIRRVNAASKKAPAAVPAPATAE